jgi:methyltransferase
MTTAITVIVALVVVQRLVELVYAERNTRALLKRGAIEVGRAHYPFIVALHALFLLLQAGRIWVIATLGPYWTTRIITLDGAPLVRSGPYRFVRHPNYLIVVGEIALLPLVFGEVGVCLVFSVLNAALLFWRIRQEDAALSLRRAGGAGITSMG